MFGSNVKTLELTLGTAMGNVRVSGTAGAARSPPESNNGTAPKLLFCWLRVASIEMPGLPPNTPVKSLMPPR